MNDGKTKKDSPPISTKLRRNAGMYVLLLPSFALMLLLTYKPMYVMMSQR